MDPVSLSTMGLKAVAEVTKALLEKAEQVEHLRKRESKFARQYKKSINDLAAEAEDIQARMNVTVQQGNTRAIAKLLSNEEGSTALKKLVTMLDTTRGFLTKQDAAANKMIGILRRKKRNMLTDALGVDDEEVAFDGVMKDATTSLETHRTDLKRQYDHFNSLYTVFLTAPSQILSRTPSPAGRMEERQERNRIVQNDIQMRFYKSPFQFTLTDAAAVDIAREVDITRGRSSRSDSYVSMMEEMGRNWVEDGLPTTTELSVTNLAEIQASLLERLLSSIRFELAEYSLKSTIGESDDGVTNDLRCAHLALMQSTMLREIERIRTRRFSVAFCGMVKAGKSLFLNALAGQNLLPSDDLPATAWPCRLLHVKGLREPCLTLDPKYFRSCIKELRAKGYGNMMKNYKPPRDNDAYSALFDDPNAAVVSKGLTSNTIRDANEKREIFKNWNDLHTKTKENLLRFEQPNFTLPDEATGREDVIDLLALVNDIIRLCGRFNIKKPHNKPDKWPLLKVEFESLRDHNLDSDFEFIDLPGVGESGGEFHEFQDLVREVAKEVNAVVPIVSFKEIPKEDWRQQLPDIVKAGLQRPPDLVLCTHLDYAKDRAYELVGSVAKTFWPKMPTDDGRNKVLSTATRMGISSRLLLKMSERQKPKFRDIWEEDSILYDCALKVLGDWQSEKTYNGLSIDIWRQTLKDQLEKSGLPKSILRLVKDMVVTSHLRILGDENTVMCKQLRKAIVNQHRLLLEMQRSREDHEKAYTEFQEVSQKYQAVLDEWEAERAKGKLKSNDNLLKGFKHTQSESSKKVNELVEAKIKEFRDYGKLKLTPPEDGGGPQLTFPHPIDAEEFLKEVQLGAVDVLTKAKKDLVEFVRTLASKAHAVYFKSLREKIKTHMTDDKLQVALKEDIITELSEKGASIENLTMVNIRQKVMHTIAVRHTGASAYRAIQDAVAKPFLKQRPVDAFLEADHDIDEDSEKSTVGSRDGDGRRRSVDDLGFMLRAPITVVASLSWLLGSGVWPFMKQSEKIVMDKQEFMEQLQKQLLARIFENLQKEGQVTLAAMMDSSWTAAKSVVEDELKSEEQRYGSEGTLKSKPVSEEKLAASLAALLNFVAAESAMAKLQTHLQTIQL
ncbi:hypothetical protein SCHPADRAFT_901671 [Schizopora paradoxa]|uniref:Dynamin N-terminal domain-containing protein n=1 Tax=Schizopora paradoxa TaxID=27342 RepID=A0A0H2RW60_9AGAM|nr:hypothetical protein SCHPADRAFT_901671 [Schizopora paradoxa]